MAYERKPNGQIKYSIEEKIKIVKKFREQLKQIQDSEKSLEALRIIVLTQIEEKGHIDFNLSDRTSPYLIGQALLKLNRKSSRGLDGIDIYHRMKQGLRVCRAISRRIQKGFYSPAPYKIVEFAKDPSDPTRTRKIGVFSTTEKVVQTLLKAVLEPIYEPLFLPNSFAYRPLKSTHMAMEFIKENLSEDYRFCIKIDIKKYFDSIDHELLLRILEEKVKSPEILHYIEDFLKSSRLEKHRFIENPLGTPPGSVLGPLLSNIYLHEILDKPVAKDFPEIQFIRFADDIVFFSKTKDEAIKLLRFVTSNLQKNNLGISDKIKKLLFDLDKDEIHFLGYTISKTENGIQILPNEMRLIEKCQKYLNIFLETISKYGNYSVIDLREYKGHEIPVKVRSASIFHQIDRFRSAIGQYRSKGSEQSNVTVEIKAMLKELKDFLFQNVTDRKRIWVVIHYAESRLLK